MGGCGYPGTHTPINVSRAYINDCKKIWKKFKSSKKKLHEYPPGQQEKLRECKKLVGKEL